MKQQEVFKKIGGIIQEIKEQYQYLQGSEDNLNDLELELFVANTHFLKDHAEILRKLNAIKGQPAGKKLAEEPKWFEPVVQPAKPVIPSAPTLFKLDPPKPKDEDEPIKFELEKPEEPAPIIEFGFTKPTETEESEAPGIDLTADTPADSYSFERDEPEVVRPELALDEDDSGTETKDDTTSVPEPVIDEALPVEEEEQAANEEPVVEIPTETPELSAEPEPVQSLAVKSMEDIQIENLRAKEAIELPEVIETPMPVGKPKEEEAVLTLNQRLSAGLKEKKAPAAATITEVIEPLADIKTAITLNDKLLFVKDLFKGYNLAYTEAIEIVNRFSNFEEADRFLKNNYVTKNDWESKKATADKFYALLRRRYA